jgi:hypothetical protein
MHSHLLTLLIYAVVFGSSSLSCLTPKGRKKSEEEKGTGLLNPLEVTSAGCGGGVLVGGTQQ